MGDRWFPLRVWQKNLVVCFMGSTATVSAMTLFLPFLPQYIRSLGVSDAKAVVQLSGIAYGATFLTAGLTAPIWGWMADRWGRKSMLVRASLGMAVAMALMGLVQSVDQLIGLRLIVGLLGGYSSSSMILVATQTPHERTGWALGVLSTGILAGSLLGPLLGGLLPTLIGIRNSFLVCAVVIFLAFLATVLLIQEAPIVRAEKKHDSQSVPFKGRLPLIILLTTGLLLMIAQMSIEPILTIVVAPLVTNVSKVTLISGLVFAAGTLGSIVSAPWWGKWADSVGPWRVIVLCLVLSSVCVFGQAFASQVWILFVLRFLMGLGLGGILPSIANGIRSSVPASSAGRLLGYSTSVQYAGQVIGPSVGGFVGAYWGIPLVFMGTAALLLLGALLNLWARAKKV